MDSIANPHLNDDPGTIIALPGEIFVLNLSKPDLSATEL
jgi:hypothetical protein